LKTYYLVGQPIGSDKYILVSHELLSMDVAMERKRKGEEGFTSLRIVPEDFIGFIKRQDKKEAAAPMPPLEIAERKIQAALMEYAHLTESKPSIKEIFVGHENYEVQIIIKK